METTNTKTQGVNNLDAQKRNSLPTGDVIPGVQNLRSIALYTYRNLFIVPIFHIRGCLTCFSSKQIER